VATKNFFICNIINLNISIKYNYAQILFFQEFHNDLKLNEENLINLFNGRRTH